MRKLMGALTLTAACNACSAPLQSPATAEPRTPAVATTAQVAPSVPDPSSERYAMSDPKRTDQPKPQVGGWRIPGTTVQLPRSGKAGEVVAGQAPAGSKVRYAEREVIVGSDGRFEVALDAQPGSTIPVRIERPGTTVLLLKVEVQP